MEVSRFQAPLHLIFPNYPRFLLITTCFLRFHYWHKKNISSVIRIRRLYGQHSISCLCHVVYNDLRGLSSEEGIYVWRPVHREECLYNWTNGRIVWGVSGLRTPAGSNLQEKMVLNKGMFFCKLSSILGKCNVVFLSGIIHYQCL